MDAATKAELWKLREGFLQAGWLDGFFQALFVYDGRKPGMWLQCRSLSELQPFEGPVRALRVELCRRRGGYLTANQVLLKAWNRRFFFQMEPTEFFGYPRCCVKMHEAAIPVALVQLHRLLSELDESGERWHDLISYTEVARFLHHVPHSTDCSESALLAAQYRRALRSHSWLVGDLIGAHDEQWVEGKCSSLALLPSSLERRRHALTNAFAEHGVDPSYVERLCTDARFHEAVLSRARHALFRALDALGSHP